MQVMGITREIEQGISSDDLKRKFREILFKQKSEPS